MRLQAVNDFVFKLGTSDMKKIIAAAAALLCLGSYSTAQAGPVLYLGAGATDFSQYENVDSAYAGKTTLGWHLDHLPLLIEASYLSTGKHDINFSSVSRSLQYRGGDISIGGFPYRNEKLALTVIAKGGYYHGRTELERINNTDLSDDTGGFTSGLGVQWRFAPWAALRLDVSALFGVSDFNGVNNDDESTLWSTTAGIVLTIPSRLSTPRAVAAPTVADPVVAAAPAPAAAPVAAAPTKAAVVPVADAEPVPGAAPATAAFAEAAPVADAAVTVNTPLVTRSEDMENTPLAAPQAERGATTVAGEKPTKSSMLNTGLRVSLRSSTNLLTRPVVGAQVDATAPRKSLVTLGGRISNAYGTWWFVTADKQNGWVPEEALLHIE